MDEIAIDGRSLTLEDVARVADGARVTLAAEALDRVRRARRVIEAKAGSDEAVYGINTGFGYLKNVRISPGDLSALQVNLIRSHAVGVGPRLSRRHTRALMALRANAMATGRSGIRAETLALLVDMLNAGVHPQVPAKGSVGASGDLAPLAHVALAMIGEGEVEVDGRIVRATEALAAAGLAPARLAAKEGLCLVNGTQAMGALGTLALLDAERLAKTADVVGAVSLEGQRGSAHAFDPRIDLARPHPGQLASARNLARLLVGGEIAESHKDCGRVQDAYSFRCMPQVHGAVRDTLRHARSVLAIELNAGTDNPLVFAEPGEGDETISGGNFHGEPLAFVLDFLAIAASELGSISERRIEQLVDPALSGHPAFLVRNSGLHSGYMMAQVTAASLVNENKILSTPASVDTIPTSANQEDHVSMGMTSARKLVEVLENVAHVLAIELLCGCQAVDLIGLSPARGVEVARALVRGHVPTLVEDRVLHQDIELVAGLVRSGAVLAAVERDLGPLE